MRVIEVNHRIDGPADGPPVVLIGSLGSDLAMWEPQVAPLTAAGYRVIRYDARGHGASPVPPGPYSIQDLGRDALALLDRLGIERASVCGLSLGGMTGMWLAANAPARVDKLILCCTSAQLGPPEHWSDRAATVRAHGTGALAETVVGRWLTPSYAAAHPDVVAALREMVASTPPEGYASACAAIQTMDQRADLARITAPTLVVAGADDPATPPRHGELIAAAVPGARLVVLPGAAHLATYERADAVNPLLLEALHG